MCVPGGVARLLCFSPSAAASIPSLWVACMLEHGVSCSPTGSPRMYIHQQFVHAGDGPLLSSGGRAPGSVCVCRACALWCPCVCASASASSATSYRTPEVAENQGAVQAACPGVLCCQGSESPAFASRHACSPAPEPWAVSLGVQNLVVVSDKFLQGVRCKGQCEGLEVLLLPHCW